MSPIEEKYAMTPEMELAAAELDWITVHGYGDSQPESIKDRTKRKIYENPFVPIGCVATAGILSMGLVSMVRGNTRNSQILMRLRVASQGLTLMALIVGATLTATKNVDI